MNKIQYGCGGRPFAGWINVDIHHSQANIRTDLTQKHPFEDDYFDFGFSEDFLEHLSQDQSLRFLCEAYRTFKKGGILRLSFPGLEGVLLRHYKIPNFTSAILASSEAYSMWGHLHFYSKASLELVAKHIGFSKIIFPEYGISEHSELCGLDWRIEQKELNCYAELTK